MSLGERAGDQHLRRFLQKRRYSYCRDITA